jgi:hypothetical protein
MSAFGDTAKPGLETGGESNNVQLPFIKPEGNVSTTRKIDLKTASEDEANPTKKLKTKCASTVQTERLV